VLRAAGSWRAPGGAGSCAHKSAFAVRLGLLCRDINGGKSVPPCWHKAFPLKARGLEVANPVSLEQ